jgi:hypothetical protein
MKTVTASGAMRARPMRRHAKATLPLRRRLRAIAKVSNSAAAIATTAGTIMRLQHHLVSRRAREIATPTPSANLSRTKAQVHATARTATRGATVGTMDAIAARAPLSP